MPRYCDVQTLPLFKIHYGGKKLWKMGEGWSDFDPFELDLTFWFRTMVQSFIKID